MAMHGFIKEFLGIGWAFRSEWLQFYFKANGILEDIETCHFAYAMQIEYVKDISGTPKTE